MSDLYGAGAQPALPTPDEVRVLIDGLKERMAQHDAERAAIVSPLADALIAAVEAGDPDAVVAALSKATEKQRKAVRDSTGRAGEPLSRQQLSASAQERANPTPQQVALALALLGTTDTAWLPLALYRPVEPDDRAVQIVEDRGKGFARRVLTAIRDHTDAWPWTRALMARGLIERPDDEEYLPLFAGALTEQRIGHGPEGVVAMIRDEPDLLDEVWAVLERRTVVFGARGKVGRWTRGVDLPEGTEYSPGDLVLPPLREAGLLERDRLLDLVLRLLPTDCESHVWLGLLLEDLDPTPDDLHRALAGYLGAATLTDPAAQKEALARLGWLIDQGIVPDAGDLAAAAERSIIGTQKNLALAGLRLLDRTARDPERAVPALAVIARGLAHSRPDIQERAVKILEQRWPKSDADARRVAEAIAAQVAEVGPSLRPRVTDLLARAGTIDDTGPTEAVDGTAVRDRVAALAASAAAEALGLDTALAAVEDGRWPAPATFDPAAAPVLHPDRAVAPVADADELVALCAQVVEGGCDGIEVERALDGIARLGPALRADAPDRLGPLLTRADRLVHPNNVMMQSMLPSRGRRLRHDAATALDVWLAGPEDWVAPYLDDMASGASALAEAPPPSGGVAPDGSRCGSTPYSFAADRMLEVGLRAHRGEGGPLLALPTHEGGWIAADALCARLRAHAEAGTAPGHLDVIGAAHRVVPSPGLDDDLRAIGTPAATAVADALAAARTSASLDRNTLIAMAGVVLVDVGPLAELPPFRRDDPMGMLLHRLRTDGGARHWSWEGQPVFGGREYGTTELGVMTLPRRPDLWAAACVLGASALHDADNETYPRPDLVLAPAVDPDVPLGRLGSAATAILLVARPPELPAIGLDLLLATAADGRADPDGLGLAWAVLHGGGMLRCGRLGPPLAEAARVSARHAVVVLRALESFLGRIDDVPQNIHAPLEALVEVATSTGCGVADPAARASLERIVASSKGAKRSKLAAAALALPVSPEAATAHRWDALVAQVERAERWADLVA